AGLIWGRRRLETAILLSVPVLLSITFLANAHRIYRVVVDSLNGIRGVQGRYLYAGLVGVAVCTGWAALAIGRRIDSSALQRVLIPITLIAPWLAAVAGFAWTVRNTALKHHRTVLSHDVDQWLGVRLDWI